MADFNAENADAARDADIQVLTTGPEAHDFEIRKDPAKVEETHIGERASTVRSFKYLMRLADMQDYFANLDAQKARDLPAGEERNKAFKDSRYSRLRAAVCRYYARKCPRGGAPF